MSIGTPYLACASAAVAGSTTLVVTVTTTTNQGDCIAVWVTTNTSTNNISGVTDSQGNTYTAGPQGPVSGTAVNGEWFVCNNANKLTSGADTITLTCTGTGGTKTLQAVGCPGVIASAPADQSNEASGNSTTPTTTTAVTTQSNELILAGELNTNPGGAIAWTGDFTAPVLSNSQHTGAAQFAAIASKILTATQTVTGSGTIAASNWAISVLTLLPAVSTAVTCLVGTTIPLQALGPPGQCSTNPGETPYDSGLTQDQGDNRFIRAVNRSFFGHLAVTKKFWNAGGDYRTGINNLANYITYGTKVLFALQPPTTGGTAADKTALANFLTAIKALGFNPHNCSIILWQEPEGGSKFGNAGFNQYQTQMAFFGPTVNASGLPLCQDVGMGAGITVASNFLNAGYAAAGVTFQGQYMDFYYAPWSRGVTLDAVAAIANSHGLPFGLAEFGSRIDQNYLGYHNYITGFFQARAQAGFKNLDIVRYEGQCSTLGTGDLTSPILTNTDPRIPSYQTMFDTLTTIPTSNTITVTSPGNQTNNINDNISLQIAAADSDPSQTLTFSATGLPAGLAISPTGLITGSPTTQAVNNVTVTATDTAGSSGSIGFTWTVNPVVTNVVTVANPGNQSTQLGAVVNLAITATDSNVAITTFTWGASGLPPGLSIAPGPAGTGVITGSPSLTSTFTVSVTATDNTGSSGNTTFTWVITNPQTLLAGKFQTIQPVNQSPIAGLGICPQLSYEISFGLTAGPGSTLPFCAVTLSFYDFDEPAGVQNFIAQVTYRVPMGATSDPNGAAVVFGRGPLRGQFMRVQFHNVDSVNATLQFLQIVGTARDVKRDDWRWDCGGNSPVIPTFVKADAAASSLVLGGMQGVTVPNAGTTVVSRLCSMYAGPAYFRAHLNNGGPANIVFKITPVPVSLFSSQDLFEGVVNPGNAGELESPGGFCLPRGPFIITFDNTGGAANAVVSAEVIAQES